MSRITALGFLHYGDHKQPHLDALAAALRVSDIPEDALVLLPEAFNAGTNDEYYNNLVAPGQTILEDLRSLGSPKRLSFVAGLIIPESEDVMPYSSVYVIGLDEDPVLLAHKRRWDGASSYKPCETPNAMNAVGHRNVALAALVCMDAYVMEETRGSHQLLRERLAAVSDVDHRILCIPARTTGWPRLIEVPHSFVALANANGEVASFIDAPDQPEWLWLPDEQKRTNRLMWKMLSAESQSK